MSDSNGYNPMRWDCKGGENCYNLKMRPKVEVFAECFPGKVGMTDVEHEERVAATVRRCAR